MKRLYEVCPDVVVMADDSVEEQMKMSSRIGDMARVSIILAGKADRTMRSIMLELGADMYVDETIGSEELVARVHSLLRRLKWSPAENPYLYPETNRVELGGTIFSLTATEFRLFSCLALNKGETALYSHLITAVWGRTVSMDTVHYHARSLKQKLRIGVGSPYRLVNHRGEGYCFNEIVGGASPSCVCAS